MLRRAYRLIFPKEPLINMHVAGPDGFGARVSFPASTPLTLVRESIALHLNLKPGGFVIKGNGISLNDASTLEAARIRDGDILNVELIRERRSAFVWNGTACNPFSTDPMPDSAIRKARWFHRENIRDSTVRRKRIGDVLRDRDLSRRQLVAMTFNRGFLPLFANWVESTRRHGIAVRDQCLVFPMDEVSDRAARDLGFCTCYDPESKILQSTGTAQAFGDHDFVRHIYFQNAVIRDLLGFDVNVLFQDVDLVWLRDPLPLLDRDEAHDAQFMYDGPSYVHAPLHANTGFMYFRVNSAARRFWDIVFAETPQMFSQRGQQVVVNRILGAVSPLGFRARTLDERKFVNGHLVGLDAGTSRIPEHPWVIHFSWTRDLDKKYVKYRNNGYWYLSAGDDENAS
ncbi:MAG: putative nucleotide-diphospho-sugar transferase [Arenicellales bacterium]